MDNTKYHSKLSEKTPTMNMKNKLYNFILIKHHIEIPLPVKPVLLVKIREANVINYVIDYMATAAGYSVLHLRPYHCVFNPTELVWNHLKHHARHLNFYISEPAKVIDLFRNVWEQKSQRDVGKTMLIMS